MLRQYRYIGSLDITIPRYNDLIPLLPRHIVISGFHRSDEIYPLAVNFLPEN